MSPSRCLLLAFLVALVAADDMSEGVTTAIESNFVPSGCEQLLANGVFSVFLGVSRVTYSSAAQSQFQSAMCSPATRVSDLGATPDGKRMQFGVYVGASSFALALSKPDAQTRLAAYRNNLCGGSGTVGQAALDTFSSWLDPNVVSEFEACQAMAQRGLAMDPLITQDGDLFTLTLACTRKDGGGITFHRLSRSGPVRCYYLSSQLRPGFRLTAAAGRQSLQCERNSDSSSRAAATIVVATSVGTRHFDLPEHFWSTAEQRMSQRLAALERQMASSAAAVKRVNAQLAQLQAKLTRLAAAVKSAAAANSGASTAKQHAKPTPKP